MTDNRKNGRGKAAGNHQDATDKSNEESQEQAAMSASDSPKDTPETSEDNGNDTGADWAEAMAEQTGSEGDAAADDWAAAMAEQGVTEDSDEDAGEAEEVRSGADVFQPLEQESGSAPGNRELSVVMDIPVKLNVVLGRTRITIKELLELSEGSVVELDGLAGDPLDILINDYLVAQGEVVVVDDKYGIRITDIITPSERVHKLNR